jgi:hypothetical protein
MPLSISGCSIPAPHPENHRKTADDYARDSGNLSREDETAETANGGSNFTSAVCFISGFIA